MKHRFPRRFPLCVLLLLSFALGGCGLARPWATPVPEVDTFALSANNGSESAAQTTQASSSNPSSTSVSTSSATQTTQGTTATQVSATTKRSTTRTAAARTTTGRSTTAANPTKPPATAAYVPVPPTTPMRAVWLSYFELPKTEGLDEAGFRALAESMMKNIADAGLNTVFLHVRAFSDAIYPSTLFPWSNYILGTGEAPAYDPLTVLLNAAHKYKLSCHAWFNPFRAANDPNPAAMAPTNPARVWLEDEDKRNDSYVYRYSGGIYLNPAAQPAQRLILEGVREIVAKYPVDGIHIDDYFYPVTTADIDRVQYETYCEKAENPLPLAQWRRDTVSAFVFSMNKAAKSKNPNMLFSVSPAGNVSANYNELYADVALWASKPGYADLLIPQLYFGYEHDTLPFDKALAQWTALTEQSRIPLVIGLAAYKVGKTDKYAGSGSNEWIAQEGVLPRQTKQVLTTPQASGFALFSYSSLFAKNEPRSLVTQIKAIK